MTRFRLSLLTLTLLDGAGRLRRVEYDPSKSLGERVVNVSHEGMIESVEGWVASFVNGKETSASIRALADLRASPHLVVRVNGVRIACRGGNWDLLLITRVVHLAGMGISTSQQTLSAPSNAAVRVGRLDVPKEAKEGVVFIKLQLLDGARRVLADNFYWHAAQKSGYRKLNTLLEAPLACLAVMKREAGAARVEVELTNYGDGVALAAQVLVRDAETGARVLPVYASDNYISLLLGEARRINIEVPKPTRSMTIELKGWNVRGAVIPIVAAR